MNAKIAAAATPVITCENVLIINFYSLFLFSFDHLQIVIFSTLDWPECALQHTCKSTAR